MRATLRRCDAGQCGAQTLTVQNTKASGVRTDQGMA